MNFDVSGKLTNTGGGAVCPIGALMPFAGANAPTNWLTCNGQEISRTDYADLFAIIGTTYGVGNGSTTFNVPNLQGRTILGVNSTYTRGSTGGSATHTPSGSVTVNGHTLTESEVPRHSHSRGNMNITGAFHIRQCATNNAQMVAQETSGAIKGEGWDTNYSQWASGCSLNSWKYYPEKVTFDASRSWLGNTSEYGDDGSHNHGASFSGSSQNTLDPYIALNYIIRAK